MARLGFTHDRFIRVGDSSAMRAKPLRPKRNTSSRRRWKVDRGRSSGGTRMGPSESGFRTLCLERLVLDPLLGGDGRSGRIAHGRCDLPGQLGANVARGVEPGHPSLHAVVGDQETLLIVVQMLIEEADVGSE